MNRFWEIIINPIFNKIKPKVIVEVGSDVGLNTEKILNYCEHENNAKLISIDPSPSYDIGAIKEKYGSKFIPIKDISLNSLKIIEKYDIILIDGDHNWYTVYNELKIIETKFDQKNFPIIILHDTSWPYGRRDLYYNPKTIPSEYLNEYKRLGMMPNKKELLKYGGANVNLNNATIENTPKNGVLTAIEDFLKQTNLNLNFYKINGFNGLGIIFPENNSFKNFIEKIVYDSDIGEIVEKCYLERIIDQNITLNSQKNQINQLKKKNTEYSQKIHENNRIILQNNNKIKKLNNNSEKEIKELNETKNYSRKLIKKSIRQENQIKNLKENNEIYQSKLDELDNETIKFQTKIQKLNKTNKEYNNKILSLTNENNNNKTQINNLNTENTKLKDNIHIITNENNHLKNEISQLNKENNNNKTQINNLNTENTKLSSKIKTLKNSDKNYQNQIQKLITINSKHNNQIKILEYTNETYKNTIESLKENNNNLIINNKVLTNNTEELILDKQNLTKQNSELSNYNNQIKSENNDLNNKNNELTKKNTNLNNKNNELTKKNT
ncbi:class I SAM-dependent methyltransferase, partial [uncultured Methanobrevibacter sp.]|uniref:class I SAM-dependent methyltransferase n=1 Tax=uncultured Methanobrevibacter sp. TaxID=253161 RepID=UPI0025CCA556